MKAAALVYGGLLIIGALGVIAVHLYGRAGSLIGEDVALLVAAVVFFWAQTGSSGNSGHGADVARPFWANFAGSFRLFALTLIGAGVGIALTTFALVMAFRAQDAVGVPIGPAVIFLFGERLALFGLVLVVVDAIYFRRTGRRL